jgi:predicted amidohydrolase
MKPNITRRSFIKNTAVTSGFAAIVPAAVSGQVLSSKPATQKAPNEIWIAGVSQMDLHAETPGQMVDQIFGILKDTMPYSPDFVCLPELFPFANVEQKLSLAEKVIESEKVLSRFSEYSYENKCYTICPVYIPANGKVFNAAMVFDRNGNTIGKYEKIHLTDYEMEGGLSCGQLFQPVIKTEFGPVGVQICFDIEWDDGWRMLRQQGAKIVFWPSAFAGGKCVNTKAWEHKFVVASATIKNTAKLCDISGEMIAQTGIWNSNLYCSPFNPEKVFLHTWPAVSRFGEIQKKYGRKIRITNFHEEEWSIIESLSEEINLNDILKEFDLKTHEELTLEAEILQKKSRS